MKKNIWLEGIMGVVVGDALGLPVQFLSRTEMERDPLTDMIGFGTFSMPAGSWSDDSSLTLASLDSIKICGGMDYDDMMERFVQWLTEGSYTPFGESYDQGATCVRAILKYKKYRDTETCGVTGEYSNGNGALMRIMPVCLWGYERVKEGELSEAEVLECIHKASALTHNHLRSQIACGMYYFMIRSILEEKGSFAECLQAGIDAAVSFYCLKESALKQLRHYHRLLKLEEFGNFPADQIASSGYVVDSIEAAVWCLLNTKSLQECLLQAANLGGDTDTIAAIAGGLAGLYYGYSEFPAEWLDKIQKRKWIEELCTMG